MSCSEHMMATIRKYEKNGSLIPRVELNWMMEIDA